MTTSAKKTPEKLTMVHAHQLVTLLLDAERGWTAKRLSHSEYAKFACMELGFPVTGAQIGTRVREFSIPTGESQKDMDIEALSAIVLAQNVDIVDLKERMARLEGWVNTTFPSKSPLKVVG